MASERLSCPPAVYSLGMKFACFSGRFRRVVLPLAVPLMLSLRPISFSFWPMTWMEGSVCSRSRFYESPHIDRIAREGMRFQQGYATAKYAVHRGPAS